MTHVLTLVAAPGRPVLDADLLSALASHLPGAEDFDWLDEKLAADLPFAPGPDFDKKSVTEALRLELGDMPVDLVIQPAKFRRKRLFLADMDSTMIGQECIDELADFVGKKAEVAEITERTMRGELVFETSLRARVALLVGLPASIVSTVIADRIRLTPGGTELVRTMKANGAYTALVSGGFTVFTSQISKVIGFDEHRSNTLIVEGDTFVGKVADPILGREAKLETLVEMRAKLGLVKEETMAIGDGANDLSMIGEAGLGIAFRAKPAVAAAAAARIDHGDLSTVLFFQGYKRSAFVTG